MINVTVPKKKRTHKERPLVTPNALAKLQKAFGTSAAVGRALGISRTAIATYLRDGKCHIHIEQAAKSHLANLDQAQDVGKKMFSLIAKVDEETRNRIQWILEIHNATFIFNEEK